MSHDDSQAPSNARPGLRGYWTIGLILFGLAACILPFDLTLAKPNNLQELPGDLKRVVHLAEIFAHGFGIAIVAIGIWLLASESRQYIPRIVACAFWPSIGVHFFKTLWARNRPHTYLNEHAQAEFPNSVFDTWVGWLPNDQLNFTYPAQSFPSGHAATVWGLAIGMAWVFPKGRWLYFSIAILASVQRITSGAHWPSDVLCGTAFAFIMAGAMTENWGLGYFLSRYEARRSSANRDVTTMQQPTTDRIAA